MLIEKRLKTVACPTWQEITLLDLVNDIREDLGHVADPMSLLYLSLTINLHRKYETERAEYRII